MARRCGRAGRELQAEYRDWLDTLPPSLEGSATAEALRAICDLDLSELESVELPRGFGRGERHSPRSPSKLCQGWPIFRPPPRQTLIITFLMVFLIQNTQNRDTSALQLKLDELIRVSESARNKLLTLEDLTEAELEQMKESFARIADRGGIGKGVIREVEADLEQAEEGIGKAKDKLAASRN
jgi:hypothetical protein